jgi:hypothetical protein
MSRPKVGALIEDLFLYSPNANKWLCFSEYEFVNGELGVCETSAAQVSLKDNNTKLLC